MGNWVILLPSVVIIGFLGLALWGLTHLWRQRRALRTHAAALGYHAEHDSRYHGNEGHVEWTAELTGSGEPHDDSAVAWRFFATRFPREEMLTALVSRVATARVEGSGALTESRLQFLRARSGEWAQRGNDHDALLQPECRETLLQWAYAEGATQIQLRFSELAVELLVEPAPTAPTLAQFAAFIGVSRSVLRALMRLP